jgi:hypothetical protein
LRCWLALVLGTVFVSQGLADECVAPSFSAARVFCAGQGPISLAAADFNGDGQRDLAVANNGSTHVSVYLGKGDGTFPTPVDYVAGAGPRALVAYDLDRDGKADLIVVNGGSHPNYADGGVSILFGNGDGTFRTAANYGVGIQPVSVTAGDFNGDGMPDLALANLGTYLGANDGIVSVLLSNGDGTFRTAVNYGAGISPSSVTAGDFNRDGRLDLVVANQSSYCVSVLLGRGDGTFQAAVNYGVGAGPAFVAAGDFNRDGRVDLAVANYSPSGGGSVSVLLGRVDGTFDGAVDYDAGTSPNSVVVADVNGDGKPDLVVADFGPNSAGAVWMLLGEGDGTFQSAVRYIVGGQGSRCPVVDDFNADNKPDVAVVSSCGVAVLLGMGDGTFPAAAGYRAGLSPLAIAAADFDRDTKLDLVVANNYSDSVSVLLGDGKGTFGTAASYGVGSSPQSVAVADFNADGRPDIAVANRGSGNVSIMLGKEDGTLRSASNYGTGWAPDAVAVGDFNGDGKPDLAVANLGDAAFARPGGVSVLLGNGDGSFNTAINYGPAVGPVSITVADFNSDGRPDLAVANQGAGPTYTNSNVSVLLGNGDGTFKMPATFGTGVRSLGVAAGDFDGDGNPDLVVANHGTISEGNISMLVGNGDGTFRPAIRFGSAGGYMSVAVGDLNGDGKLDLAVASRGGRISVFPGTGDGTFQPSVDYGVDRVPYSILATDLNGDNKPDLMIGNLYSKEVSVLLNTCASSGTRLSALRRDTTVTISWPMPLTGFVLESTANPGLTNWQSASETTVTNNNRREVTVPLDRQERYFRLRKP